MRLTLDAMRRTRLPPKVAAALGTIEQSCQNANRASEEMASYVSILASLVASNAGN